jgi:hypothetical protein
MKEKVWIVVLAILLVVFVSWPCLADEKEASEKTIHAKETPKSQAKPNKRQPQQKQVSKQVKSGISGQSGKPSVGKTESTARQGIHETIQQPGKTHPVERAELNRKLKVPVTSEAQDRAVRQGIHETVQQPGKTHPVERAELNQKLKVPVTREAQERAVNHYREERARFVRHAPPMKFVPEQRVILTRIRIVPSTYYYRRNVFYETYGYVPYPFIYTMYPRYGLWDAIFLGFMVERAEEREYALMYYNHRNEEEMIQWRQEMDRMAMDNAELRAKLAIMDQQVANLQGTPVDSAYVPEGAKDIALSPDVIDKLPQVLPTTTGQMFIYPRNGQSEQQQAKDRYACHSWAMSQTGYDPTQPTGGVPESQTNQQRSDYQRAMGACLDARGYTAK